MLALVGFSAKTSEYTSIDRKPLETPLAASSAIIQGNSLLPISFLPQKPDYCSKKWLSNYWPELLVDNASMICYCESEGEWWRVNNSLWGVEEYAVGLFQINILVHTEFFEDYLKIPENNIMIAINIYNNEGWGAWKNCAEKFNIL